jgi:hypothetical protein
LLEVIRAQKASDPRDYICALLGHPSALLDSIPIAEPDYNKAPQELFLEVMMKILSQTRSLRILSVAHHGDTMKLDEGTPSWIPTWSRDAYVLSLVVY